MSTWRLQGDGCVVHYSLIIRVQVLLKDFVYLKAQPLAKLDIFCFIICNTRVPLVSNFGLLNQFYIITFSFSLEYVCICKFLGDFLENYYKHWIILY